MAPGQIEAANCSGGTLKSPSITQGTFAQRLGEGVDAPAQVVRARCRRKVSRPGDGMIGLLPEALLWPVPDKFLYHVLRHQRTCPNHLEEKEESELQGEEKSAEEVNKSNKPLLRLEPHLRKRRS